MNSSAIGEYARAIYFRMLDLETGPAAWFWTMRLGKQLAEVLVDFQGFGQRFVPVLPPYREPVRGIWGI